MRLLIISAILTLVLCPNILAQEEKLPLDIPVYPGGMSTTEINVTSEDILPMLQAMLPMAGSKLGPAAEAITPEDIAELLKDIRRIEFLQVDVPPTLSLSKGRRGPVGGPGVAESRIAGFYAKNLPEGRWSRIYYKTDSKGVTAAYAQPNTEAVYGFRVTSVKSEGKTIRRASIAKMEGRIDLARVLTVLGKLFTQIAIPKPAPEK